MVDARIGPGLKSMSKCKKRKKELDQNGTTKFGQSRSNVQNICKSERFRTICRINKSREKMLTKKAMLCDENSAPTSPSSNSDIDRMSDDAIELDLHTYDSISTKNQSRRNKWKSRNPEKNRKINRSSTIIDAKFWTCVKTCCGIIFESRDYGAVIVDYDKYMINSCPKHEKKIIVELNVRKGMTSVIKSLPPKKQHLHRQNMIEISSTGTNVQTTPIDYSIANHLDDKSSSQIQFYPQTDEIRGTNDGIVRQKSDTKVNSNRVYKKSITRLLPKKITKDLSVITNLVKLCTDKRLIDNALVNTHESQFAPHNENKNITNTVNTEPTTITKYSDNSSDSGYEPDSLKKTSTVT